MQMKNIRHKNVTYVFNPIIIELKSIFYIAIENPLLVNKKIIFYWEIVNNY